MIKYFFKNYVLPVATLSGGIIGVGFLALPYVAMQSGIWLTLLYFVVLTALVATIHSIFGQIALKTPDFKRWPGFVEFYFGKPAKWIILPLMVLGIFSVMLVYLIVGGQFLSSVFNLPLESGGLVLVLAYWVLGSLLIFFGVKIISRFDVMALVLLLASLVFIFFKGFGHISISNLAVSNFGFRASDFSLPYGPILFSLWGTGLIPEVEEMVRGNKQSLKKIIIFGTLIPAIFYLLFMLLILAITGPQTTDSALLGIQAVLGDGLISLVVLIGVLTTFVAFVAQGLLLKKIFMYDLGIQEFPALVFVCIIPLALFLAGLRSFIPLVSFIGAVLLGIEGILILLIYKKIGGKKIILYPLIIFFALGILYQVIYFTS